MALTVPNNRYRSHPDLSDLWLRDDQQQLRLGRRFNSSQIIQAMDLQTHYNITGLSSPSREGQKKLGLISTFLPLHLGS